MEICLELPEKFVFLSLAVHCLSNPSREEHHGLVSFQQLKSESNINYMMLIGLEKTYGITVICASLPQIC